MNLPGWKLHPLKGRLKGYFSVWVNGNWRMTFTFEGTHAVLVDYQDSSLGATAMTRIFNPPHPGLTLRDDVLPALELTVTVPSNWTYPA